MKHGLLLAALLLGAGLAKSADAAPRRAVSHHAAPHRAAPARVDWTRNVVATPEGGFRMGNPAARLKLVEYGSITCPHCALFSAEGGATLRDNYVKSGRLSWEYRPFMIFPTDPGLFMLLRCQGATAFFPTSERLYAEQRSWSEKLQALPEERIRQIQALAPKDRFAALVEATKTAAYFHLTPARAKACLSDDANLKALLAITEQGSKAGVTGTPAFFVNGKLTGVAGWEGLEPLLKSAGG